MPRNAKRHQIEHLFFWFASSVCQKKRIFSKGSSPPQPPIRHPVITTPHTYLSASRHRKKAADQPLRQSAAYNKKGMYYLMKCFISSKADVALPVALSNIEALYHESVTRFVDQSSPYSLASIHHQKSPVTLS